MREIKRGKKRERTEDAAEERRVKSLKSRKRTN